MGRTGEVGKEGWATLTSNLETIGFGQAAPPLVALIRASSDQHWCCSLPPLALTTFCWPGPGPGVNFQLPTSVAGRAAGGMSSASLNGWRISGLVGKASV